MSFHGGFLGMMLAMGLFARRRAHPVLVAGRRDRAGVPFGLFFGRLANFINGELCGRVTDVPWAMRVSRRGGDLPRHPSQLYEAALEGIVLFLVPAHRSPTASTGSTTPGFVSGVFCTGYGAGAHVRASSSASRTSRSATSPAG